MPYLLKKQHLGSLLVAVIFFMLANPLPAKDFRGLDLYYVRLDQHYRAHRAIGARVTMVPAENEFRAANFSQVLVEGSVRADRQSGETTVANLVRKETFARILETHGLKSVKTLDQETVVSYEGVIISPADIAISSYDPKHNGYPYTARVQFSPLSFPDQWETLKRRYSVKQILNDFFLLFK